MSKPDGGSAFPVTRREYLPGMTLRDYFAAVALPLAWEIECDRPTGPYSEDMEPSYAGAATRAYYMADAMIKERAK